MIILGWLLYFAFIFAVLYTLILLLRFRQRMQRRVQAAQLLRRKMRRTVQAEIKADISAQQPWHWRIQMLESVSIRRMVWSRKKLDPANFYNSTEFLKSRGQTTERKPVYVLFAHIGGEWGIVGFEAHQEHAVEFISFIDDMFGDGTAFVCKLPDKAATEDAQKHVDLAAFLAKLDRHEVDFDEELSKLTKEQDGK